ncbi:MAG: SDR family NAD(P)-dependent oxidoreductase [Pirellulales bacterium]|nr:SDR family NAD(P)-dependent oxidoreductase [Pirellulales bacterium]
MPNDNTERRAVLITGASTGIGAASAWELDRRGFRVFAGVRNDEAARRLREKASERLTPVTLDVTEAGQIAAVEQNLRQVLGERGLFGLVNNAGIVVAGPLELLPLENFRRQLEVNVTGLLAVTQAFLPLLRKGRGRIVNISSINGAVAPPYMGPYSASKYAVEALSDALRLELRHAGVSVSVVAPGPIDTPIWEKSFQAADSLAEQVSPEVLANYQADLDILRKTVEATARSADPVETVVHAVVHALTAPKPKIRYYLRFRNRLVSRGFKVVPDGLRDRIICRATGLK